MTIDIQKIAKDACNHYKFTEASIYKNNSHHLIVLKKQKVTKNEIVTVSKFYMVEPVTNRLIPVDPKTMRPTTMSEPSAYFSADLPDPDFKYVISVGASIPPTKIY